MRLSDLAKGFEEATIDKNDQLEKTLKMEKSLETAGRLRRVGLIYFTNSDNAFFPLQSVIMHNPLNSLMTVLFENLF